MAKLTYFKKVRDDNGEVEYHFGPSREALDAALVIDKATFAAVPGTQSSTPAGQIILRARRAGEWPEVGVITS
ncbi:hypothetical protein ACFXK0_18680 [Nocardia sp. NPDC059177]|uniref:hypothetical protein n=1 Tax=Nocardia sp. NPDC059177 TaxID=3346759 RepID=UPI003699300B